MNSFVIIRTAINVNHKDIDHNSHVVYDHRGAAIATTRKGTTTNISTILTLAADVWWNCLGCMTIINPSGRRIINGRKDVQKLEVAHTIQS